MDIGDGDQFLLTRRLITDLNFLGSTSATPTVDFTLQTRTYPGANYNQTDTANVIRSATTPVEQWTNEVDMRLRGRSFALKVESSGAGTAWKLGIPRVDLRPDGRR